MIAVLAFAANGLEEVNFVGVELVVVIGVNQPVQSRAVRPVAVDVKALVRIAHAHGLPDGCRNRCDLFHLARVIEGHAQ